jgi:hypothetical protein
MKGLTHSNGQPFLKTDHMDWGQGSLEKSIRERSLDSFEPGTISGSGLSGAAPFIISPIGTLKVSVGQGLAYAPAATWPMLDADLPASGFPLSSDTDTETAGERIFVPHNDKDWDSAFGANGPINGVPIACSFLSRPYDVGVASHGLHIGDIVVFSTASSLPSGLFTGDESSGVKYLVQDVIDINTIRVTTDTQVSISIASPAVVAVDHGFLANDPVVFTNEGGALPTGITSGVEYYVTSPIAGSFNISATPGGASIDTSGTQSGTHYVNAGLPTAYSGAGDGFVSLLTPVPQSSGNLNIPVVPGTKNHIFVSYLKTASTAPADTIESRLISGRMFYPKCSDGYSIRVVQNATAGYQLGGKWMKIGVVDIVSPIFNGTVDQGWIDQSEMPAYKLRNFDFEGNLALWQSDSHSNGIVSEESVPVDTTLIASQAAPYFRVRQIQRTPGTDAYESIYVGGYRGGSQSVTPTDNLFSTVDFTGLASGTYTIYVEYSEVSGVFTLRAQLSSGYALITAAQAKLRLPLYTVVWNLAINQFDNAGNPPGKFYLTDLRVFTVAKENSITTSKIVNGSVTNAKMAANSVTTSNIVDANITDAKIASTPDASRISRPKIGFSVAERLRFFVQGTLEAGVNIDIARAIIDRGVALSGNIGPLYVSKVFVHCDTTPETTDLVLDIRKNGTISVFKSANPATVNATISTDTADGFWRVDSEPTSSDIAGQLKNALTETDARIVAGDILSIRVLSTGAITRPGGDDLLLTVVLEEMGYTALV